jgi:hypothetical protein
MTLIGIACMGLVTIGAQGPRRGDSTSRPYVVGKNALGQPDLEAVWSNNSITPLQRPAAWALTDAELEQLRRRPRSSKERAAFRRHHRLSRQKHPVATGPATTTASGSPP